MKSVIEIFKETVRTAESSLPSELRTRILVVRRASLWRKTGIIFVHVPKAAGTSVNEALYGRFMGHITAQQAQKFAPKTFNLLPSFAIVRNPWARLVSAYRFAKAGAGQGKGLIAGIHNAVQYQIPEFENFPTFVEEWLKYQRIETLDFVFRPQLPFIADRNGEVLVDFVGRMENLASSEHFVTTHTKKQINIGHSNKSGDMQDFRTYYSPDLVKSVGKIYSEDIRILNYAFD